ncbi:MAG TPA: phosphoribosylamine--glycine ligase [Xanthomonadaceae bacterium]|nr:phosphoribosylamine--glycine ligase [Xanthomonadaceae bacterium]
MKILVIGSGGREHALAWKLAQSARVAEVIVAPGNAGTAREAKCRNAAVAADDLDGLLDLAEHEDIDLTVVGPEVPLVAGVVDLFEAAGRRIFGPRKVAAELEGSKAFAKNFLARHGIPTAAYGVFTDLDAARAFLAEHGAPIVVKADGLAAGKGVVVARTVEEADAALVDMLAGNRFGVAGARVVVEEFLEGEEASFIVIAAGTQFQAMASSQDHKRRDDADLGPNTGGMGAYSPAPVVTPEVEARIRAEVIEPTLRGLLAEDRGFTGFLYAGVMIADDGTPRVLEFNVRCGDPETQPIMLRLRSDLLDLIEAALEQRLDAFAPAWDPRPSLGVVMAACGYPDNPRKGDAIAGLDAPDGADTKVFHAGTALDGDGRVVSAGGRVLTVCALGDTVVEARSRAYARVDSLAFEGAFCRRDIAWRAVARETAEPLA